MAVPSLKSIAEYWGSHYAGRNRQLLCVDAGEPSCFACGYFSEYWKDRWSKVRGGLERAHIVARSQGGSDTDPSNFVLLCPECHKAAPMTRDPQVMFDWIARQPDWIAAWGRALFDELGQLDVDVGKLAQDTRVMPAFRAWLFAQPHNRYGTHFGSGGSASTVAQMVVDFIRETQDPATLESLAADGEAQERELIGKQLAKAREAMDKARAADPPKSG